MNIHEATVGEFAAVCNLYDIPDEVAEGVYRYITQRIATGSFMRAVLENDLIGAATKADGWNRVRLHLYVQFMHDQLPPASYGSVGNVKAWLRERA